MSLLLIVVSLPAPAQAQWWGDGPPRPPGLIRRAPPPPSDNGGFFEDLFGGGRDRGYRRQPPPQRYSRPRPEPPPRHVDYSHAPPPVKEAKPEPGVPITSIVVMGDGMADWLAYGLEDAFSDSPNVEIVRKVKQYSGLIHYQTHSDLDWWHVARDILAKEKPNYVVMMLGLHDRQNISERDIAKEAQKQEAQKKAAEQKADAGKGAPVKNGAAEEAAKSPPKSVNGVLEFRNDQWAKAYSHRIDETIAALKSKGVPVFWVGLPSIRGTKSTADALYLDSLYRARAEKDGAVYIDVWDGFVDDSGKYTSFGPDYEGQIRRLRTPDGVFFTKYGARKLAHYVEREIRRYMTNRAVVALPTGPAAPAPANGSPAARPLVGPVVPLTAISSGGSDALLGAPGVQPARDNADVASVLIKGDALKPLPGRADDHAWPLGSAVYGKAPKAEPTGKPAKNVPAAAVKPAAPTSAALAATGPSPAAAAEKVTRSTPKEIAPAPRAKASPETKAPVTAKAPVETHKSVESKPAEARRRPASLRHERAKRRTEAREAYRLVPPGRIEHRPPAPQQRPATRSNDDIFGDGGLFGWMR